METAKTKESLLGLRLSELEDVAREAGLPRFAGKQMADWLYRKGVSEIGQMTNLSQKARETLAERWTVGAGSICDEAVSRDGTVKRLLTTADGRLAECVYIPEGDRATLCMSSQSGCRMGCRFCATGKQGFKGNLTAAEMLSQLYALPEWQTVTNVVLMGQGEPMDNLDNVLRVCDILTSQYALAWSPKRITVSSVGVRDKLKRFIEESHCHLAISLHSPFSDERAEIMPAEKMMPIEETIALLNNYDWSGQRRLTFEYIVFGGMNDDDRHVRAIAKLLRGLFCRVNLIRFHAVEGAPFTTVSEQKMEEFRDKLNKEGIISTIRASRGQDIEAACGLLAAKHINL